MHPDYWRAKLKHAEFRLQRIPLSVQHPGPQPKKAEAQELWQIRVRRYKHKVMLVKRIAYFQEQLERAQGRFGRVLFNDVLSEKSDADPLSSRPRS